MSDSLKKANNSVEVVSVDDNKGDDIKIDETPGAKVYDKAYQYKEATEGLVIDPVLEKKMVRKIDFSLLPVIALLMSCQLMDKTTNSYASIMGLREDLNMSGQTYSWVGSSFYFGFLVFQFFSNRLLQKFPVSKTLGIIVIIWGVILCCHAACYSSAPFLVCRVLLGCCESVMNPAYMLLTSMWYRRDDDARSEVSRFKVKINQQFFRTVIWFGSQGFGTILGASILYGLYQRTYAIASWRLLYVITGIITIVLGVIEIIHVPDIPVKAWFLNDLEKKYVVERSKENQTGFGNTKFKKDQVIEAFTDVKSYILFVYGVSYALANGGFTNFGSILLHEDFGFETGPALLMNMCGGSIDIVCPIFVLILSYFIRSRLLLMACINVFVVIGMCCLAFSEPRGSRLFGYLTFYVATIVIAGVLSYISSNITGSSKKIIVHWFFAIGYSAGNIIGPQTYREEEAPNYVGAKVAMVIAFTIGTACVMSLYTMDLLENKRRDRKKAELGDKYEVPEDFEFADLTDKQNPEFRYSL